MISRKIQILPDFIANQIAAGEVVQRPESVVKELVENSIDAGADSIAVIVKDAGKKLIHVIDNGSGMDKEDLELSVKRHATSKIVSQEDLENILTYGFRGEALASISSVAHLEIRTKKKEQKLGWQLISDPVKGVKIEPASLDKGTQIFVKNLFFNVPARRKFLRSNLTEFRHISNTMIRLAISKPDVRFTFYDDENLVFDVKSSDLTERIIQVLGNIDKEQLIPLEDDNQYLDIMGYIGNPELARRSRYEQYLFLNDRSIKSKSINHAVFSAFEDLIDKGSHPLFIIMLNIDPSKVDVNIHPQKHEVKFEDESYVYKLIQKSVMNALRKRDILPDLNFDSTISRSPYRKVDEEDNVLVNVSTGEVIEAKQSENPKLPQRTTSGDFLEKGKSSFQKNFEGGEDRITKEELNAFDELMSSSRELFSENDRRKFTLWNDYLVEMSDSSINIINISRARQRIIYDKLIESSENSSPVSQQLLFPVTKEISGSMSSLAMKYIDKIKDIGFDIDISERSITLNSIPNALSKVPENELLNIIFRQFDNDSYSDSTKFTKDLIKRLAVRSTQGKSDQIRESEIDIFAQELHASSNTKDSPTGKPIQMKIDTARIEKFFHPIKK